MKNVLFIVLLYLPLSGMAYNIKNHERITRKAIELLNKKYGANYITGYEAKQIIRGNLSEDKFNSKWLIRPFNQHFYNPLKEKQYWKRNKSIDRRFEKLQRNFTGRVNKSKYYYSIGEIIHHLQDETVPAHVVPIFHWVFKKDKFDEQQVQELLPVNLDLEEVIGQNNDYASQLLKKVTIQTLNNIRQKFNVEIRTIKEKELASIDWSYFWKENPKGWFGEYGIFGNRYLNDTIEVNDKKYIIDNNIYKTFSRQQLNLAVSYTARFIQYAKELNKAAR